MKCEIIKDLLPLYIEDLCSAESRTEVERHLEQCKECQQEYLQLHQDYVSKANGQTTEVFLEEKALFEKSRQEIKESFVNKVIKKFFTVISVSGLFINVAMVIITFIMYHYKYPKLYFKELGAAQIWILILPFLPTVLALIGKTVIWKYKKYKLLSKIILAGTIPAVLAGGFCTLIFMLIPPVSSTTRSLSNYMKVDGDMESFESCVNSFFPDQIPVCAKQADYFYQRYTSFFKEEANVEASWILTPSEYDTMKQQVLKLRQFKNSHLSESDGNGTILSTLQPENVTIVFEYNDTIKKVTYRAYTTKNY